MRPSEPPDLLTTEEVAKQLRVPRKQLYELIKNEGLPAIKLSAGRYRIDRADLNYWLESRRTTPMASTNRS